MPRHPHDRGRDDGREEPPRPRRKGLPAWAIALIVVGPVAILVTVGGTVLLTRGLKASAEARQQAAAQAAEPLLDETGAYNPADLRRFLVGKPEAEAFRFFGTPLRATAAGHLSVWLFPCATRDPATGQKDIYVTVICERQRIERVGCGDSDRPPPKVTPPAERPDAKQPPPRPGAGKPPPVPPPVPPGYPGSGR